MTVSFPLPCSLNIDHATVFLHPPLPPMRKKPAAIPLVIRQWEGKTWIRLHLEVSAYDTA